ncbi:MAG TPA: gpW family head-tail joining protein [Casimicrobiaceae bacterium]|jgi:hypothetical protein
MRNFDPNRTIFAGLPAPTLQAWLLSAQTAYASLAAGGRVESVSYAQGDGSKSVTYTRANMGELVALISLLQRQLGIVPARHALRPVFR